MFRNTDWKAISTRGSMILGFVCEAEFVGVELYSQSAKKFQKVKDWGFIYPVDVSI